MSPSELLVALERARRRTEDLLEPLSDEQLTGQISPLQSPLVWDLAHIGHFEELWLLRRVGGRNALSPEYDDLYEAHTVSVHALGLDVAFEAGEPLRVEISSKFRREQVELEASQAGLRVESWWTDRQGDFAVALVLPDAAHRKPSSP